MILRFYLLAILALTLAACGAAPQSTSAPINDPTALLVQSGWTLGGGADITSFTVPAQGSYDATQQQILDVSKAAGLDFSRFAGKALSLQTYPLNEASSGGQPVRGNVLMDGANVAGAWLSVGDQVYALSAKP